MRGQVDSEGEAGLPCPSDSGEDGGRRLSDVGEPSSSRISMPAAAAGSTAGSDSLDSVECI